MSRIEQFFEYMNVQSATIAVLVWSAVMGLIGSAAAGAAQFKHGGWGGVLRALIIGIVVAILVGFGLDGYVTSQFAKFAIIGGCAAIGEDIWFGLKAIGTGLRQDPLAYIQRVLAALRGQPSNETGDR